MVITNQGVAIQPGFSCKTTCSFKNRPIGCVYKTGAKYASKDDIELVVPKAFRELLLAVRVLLLQLAVPAFELRLTVLLGKLLNGFSLGHTVIYDKHTNKNTIKK